MSAIWGSRERIVVGPTGEPEGRTLIRRGARLAEKGAGGGVLAVCMARSDGLTSASSKELALRRALVEDLGGTFHQVVGDDIPAALLAFARGANATPEGRARRALPAGVELDRRAARTYGWTPTEWHLLEVLVRNCGRLIGQSSCSRRCGGPRTGRRPTIRACTWPSCGGKWEADPSYPRHFVTEPGMGYRFEKRAPRPSSAGPGTLQI